MALDIKSSPSNAAASLAYLMRLRLNQNYNSAYTEAYLKGIQQTLII